jgi:CelD/BcsL family acetyltransferase involved in cellulose biosynthesis
MGAPQADYGDVICAERSTVQVLAWSFRELQKDGDWQEGLLEGLPAESRMVRYAAQLPADVRACIQLIASETCYTIMLGNQAEETLDGLARKQHLRRRQNKLEKAGKVVFRHLESVAEALQHLEFFFVSQRRRRAIHGKSSAAENEEFRDLLRNLVQEFDLKKELHFGVLELDGKALAWHLSFEVHDKLLFYQQTFEVDAWDFAPGEALLRYLLLFAKGRVHREFDFTRGDEPFKARFANHERTIYKIWLQRPGLRGKVVGGWRSAEGSIRGLAGRVRTAAKAEKGIFERWRLARGWWRERTHWLQVSSTAMELEAKRANAGWQLARHIWNSERILVLAGGNEFPDISAPDSSDIRIIPGGLGDLVDFAQQYPWVISPSRVLSLRGRFRKGDRAFVEMRDSQHVLIAWITTRALGEVIQIPEKVPEFEPAMILYEIWEPQPGNSEDVIPLFDRLMQEAKALGIPLWICGTKESDLMQCGIERLGFRQMLEIRRLWLFGWTVRKSIGGMVGRAP